MTETVYVKVEKITNGKPATFSVFPVDLVAFIFGQQHLPLVDGLSQADWLRKELAENHGVYETGRGCPTGRTIRFSEVRPNADH